MRLNILTAIFFCLAINLSAQVKFGVKSFYSVSYTAETAQEYVNLEPLRIHNIAFQKAEAKKGIGFSMMADNERLFFMADGMYATSGREFALQSVKPSREPLDPALSYTTNEVDFRLAVNSGFKYKNLKLGVGPELSIAMSRTEDLSNIEEITTKDSKLQGGFNFLIGYEFFDLLHLDLKHTYIFQDVTNEFSYLGMPMNMEANAKYIELTLGFYL